ARFQGDRQGAAAQPPAAQPPGRRTQGQDLGVRGGVPGGFAFVVSGADDRAVRVEYDGSHRDVAAGGGFPGLLQGQAQRGVDSVPSRAHDRSSSSSSANPARSATVVSASAGSTPSRSVNASSSEPGVPRSANSSASPAGSG